MNTELENKIAEVMGTDPELRALLGSTDEENRVYLWNPNDIITYGAAIPGAIIFRILDLGRGGAPWSWPSQSGDLLLFVRGLGVDQATSSAIAERVRKLFDMKNLTTDNWDVKWIEVNDASDGAPEGTASNPIYNSNVSFNMRNVFYRGT